MSKRRLTLILLAAVPLAVACGDDDDGATAQPAPPAATEPAGETTSSTSEPRRRASGTKIVLGPSEYGRMLFNDRDQAIYIFERDERRKSNCYGDCAAAWPPVYTKGRPRAGAGVHASLLGTIRRRDGKRQVTYAGQPLYYYVNEGPGEVRCHNVNLNGGLWWVVGPNGRRRP